VVAGTGVDLEAAEDIVAEEARVVEAVVLGAVVEADVTLGETEIENHAEEITNLSLLSI